MGCYDDQNENDLPTSVVRRDEILQITHEGIGRTEPVSAMSFKISFAVQRACLESSLEARGWTTRLRKWLRGRHVTAQVAAELFTKEPGEDKSPRDPQAVIRRILLLIKG